MSIVESDAIRIVDQQVLVSAISTNTRPARPGALSASLTHAWRAVLKLKHVPTQLLDATMFPILMTLLFTYLFGGALAGSTDQYLQQFIPGIFVMTVAMSSSYTALGLSTDISKGIFDRFRSLPFWRPSVLVGALLGDTVRYSLTAMVVIVLGLVLGFRPDAGLVGVILALGVLLIFAFSLSWIWTTVGLLMDDPQSVMLVSQMASFPLLFVSNVFVDPETMPEFLQAFVNVSPISLTVTAVRGLMHGNVTATQIGYMLLSSAIIVAIFAPLTMYLYNRKNTV